MYQKAVEKALEVLQAELSQMEATYNRECDTLRKAISDLKNPANGKVRKGSWKGMSVVDGIQAYLAQCDGPVPLDRLVENLAVGGIYLGDNPARFVGNVRSTLGNTRARFNYNERTNKVSLKAGYQPPPKKAAKKKKKLLAPPLPSGQTK